MNNASHKDFRKISDSGKGENRVFREMDMFNHLSDFDNVLVVDEFGNTLYYDLADLNILAKLSTPEEFLGKKVTSFYTNLTDENSTLMTVLRTGKALCNVSQEMVAKTGSSYISKSSTYPIIDNDQIVGAIEFSRHYYTKENMHYLDQYKRHKVYRKNNTIYTIEDLITKNKNMQAIKVKMERIAKHDSTDSDIRENGYRKRSRCPSDS